MPSHTSKSNTPKIVFVDKDYEKIDGSPPDVIARRQAIKDRFEKHDDEIDQTFEVFDLSRLIKELENNRNIYFTDENDEIIGFLNEQPKSIAKLIYSHIGKKICEKYLDKRSSDFQEMLSELTFELFEIEVMTKNGFITDVNLIGEYDGMDKPNNEKSDSSGEKDLFD